MNKVNIKVKDLLLKCVLYIKYLVKFNKNYIKIQALIKFNNEVNAMTSAYTAVLKLRIYFTNVENYKIDRSIFLTY